MKKSGRYNTSGSIEDSYEPGSRGRVLQNKIGVTSRRKMDEIEAREQFRALNEFLEMYTREHRFTAADICTMHEVWLGATYEWAGMYRSVNISKDGFPFAMAVAHTELVLIHPFREGNGRLARMLSVLMGLQAGLPPLDFGCIKGRFRQRYFAAVRSGMGYDYVPMEAVFRTVLEWSLRGE